MKYASPTIINETALNTRAVSAAIRYVFRHLDLDGSFTCVKVKHHTKSHYAYGGRCYIHARSHGGSVWDERWGMWKDIRPQIPRNCSHLIVCRIAKPEVYPVSNHTYDHIDVPDTIMMETWEHALVAITAHEAMHLRQWKTKPRSRRGLMREADTEWAARRIHDDWVRERWNPRMRDCRKRASERS